MSEKKTVELDTNLGRIRGNVRGDMREFLGIRYATAPRFSYAELTGAWEGVYDATAFGPACSQYRTYFPHLDVPERRFYYREFREETEFTYSEDCLNLNIYAPAKEGRYPVLVYIHGGGFNSMCNSENYLDGAEYVRRGIVLVTINYRVGIFGYLTHPSLAEKYGRDGNFGLDDQIKALEWVRLHIRSFGGDPENITVMGQSAGAISIQYLCLTGRKLFNRAVMMSGAGAFPKIALPKDHEATQAYWQQVIDTSGAKSFEEFRQLSDRDLLAAVEEVKKVRKDNQTSCQPVIDGFLLKDRVDRLILHPAELPYLVGYTNNDMFTAVIAHMAHKYARQTKGYLYYFDVDAPGDRNQAFHSSDLRYVFGTLDRSFRPYDETDRAISALMIDYIAAFARTGDPNHEGAPVWTPGGKKALCIARKGIRMGRPGYGKLIANTFKGDPT